MKTNVVCGGWLAALCAGVAMAALSMVVPARAADLEFKAPAPLVGDTMLWGEGGVFWTGGDPLQAGGTDIEDFYGLGCFGGSCGGGIGNFPPCSIGVRCLNDDPFNVNAKMGWDAAIGFDHRFAGTNWHVNGEGRFGDAKGSAFDQESLALITPTEAVGLINASTAGLNEWHWQGDIGLGYDVITGPSPLQVKFGLRIADITQRDTILSNGALLAVIPPTFAAANWSENEVDERSFLGLGPRIGLEGSIPLYGFWTFDYKGDAAVLYGNTKISSTSTENFGLLIPGVVALSATGLSGPSLYWSKWITVLNGDIQGGIGYWITPHLKLAASVRVDAFLDPLRQNPDDTLPAQSVDRFYWGPQLTLTGRF